MLDIGVSKSGMGTERGWDLSSPLPVAGLFLEPSPYPLRELRRKVTWGWLPHGVALWKGSGVICSSVWVGVQVELRLTPRTPAF